MKLLVFTTKRQIRNFIAKSGETLLPKLLTIGEFFDRIILPPKPLVGKTERVFYLYQAAKSIDVRKLGIDEGFTRFIKQSDTIYSFLKETFQEQVLLQELASFDLYADFSEHIQLMQALRESYKQILEAKGLTDTIFLDSVRINEAYLSQFESIHIDLAGYLTRFDREILLSIDRPLTISFMVSPFNLQLAKKMFDIDKVGIYEIKKSEGFQATKKESLPALPSVEIASFSNRIEQTNFVFAKIAQFVEAGLEPQNIAVVLPSGDFKEYLQLFDSYNNINFSMGDTFTRSPLYIKLEAIYKILFKEENEFTKKVTPQELAEAKGWQDFKDIEDFIEKKATSNEKRLIEEPLFVFKNQIASHATSIQELLELLLLALGELSFDDVKGGQITAMELLESRGVQFDGVIVPDFNDEYIPRVSQEDFLFNTQLRQMAGLPTRMEKEGLQKHYYYTLFAGAKRVAVCYVENEENDGARFLYELQTKQKKEESQHYSGYLFRLKSLHTPLKEIDVEFEKPKKLSPTALEVLLKCPLRYYLQYVANVNGPKERFRGEIIHNAIRYAIDAAPGSPQIYYQKIMEYIRQNTTRVELLYFEGEWSDRLYRFAKDDYELLEGKVEQEKPKQKVLDGVILGARADRVVRIGEKIKIYDYKSNNTSNYLNHYQKDTAKLQAEFYAYIWDTDEVYFWDLKNVKLQRVDTKGAKERLQEALALIEFKTTKTKEEGYCLYCPYRFGCKGIV